VRVGQCVRESEHVRDRQSGGRTEEGVAVVGRGLGFRV
jgi:hypothetical protein